MRGEIDRSNGVTGVGDARSPEIAAGAKIDRIGDHRKASFTKNANGEGHVHRRGDEQPALTLDRLHQITGERRAFEDVARTILINGVTLIDPDRAPNLPHRLCFAEGEPSSKTDPPVNTSLALGKRRTNSIGVVTRPAAWRS